MSKPNSSGDSWNNMEYQNLVEFCLYLSEIIMY